MKSKIIFSLLFICFFKLVNSQSIWVQKPDFPGINRYSTNYFSIGGKGYIGMGYNNGVLIDLWEFDPPSNVWTQKADFPIGGRNASACFTIGSNGYVVAGVNGVVFTTETYAYDQSLNSWSIKADFPLFPPPQDCMGFSVGTDGYVVGGYNGSIISDMYCYNSLTDSWSTKSSFPGGVRSGLRGFVLNNKAYLGTGYDGSVVYKDFYCYDPGNDSWTPKADLPGDARGAASCFDINGYGYLGGGYDGNTNGNFFQDFYRYDYTSDTWTPVAYFPGSGSAYTACFSIGAKGYVGTGGVYGGPYYNNFFEFIDGIAGLYGYNLISGKIFYDSNNNQTLDSGEAPIQNKIIKMLPGPVYTSSDNNGSYVLIADTGSHDILVPNAPIYYSYSPSIINVVFTQINVVDSNNNFAFAPVGLINDLRISVTPIAASVRAGFPDNINITYANIGTTTMNGTIDLQLDSNLNYLTTVPYDSSIVQTGQLLSWTFANLTPGESRSFIAKCMISSSVVINDTISMTATINPVAGDTVPGDNTDSQIQIAVGSYDPNDIAVNKDQLDIQQITNWGWLEYLIRFQNTGNASAIDITVKDSLPAFIDVPSFEMLASSFPCNFKIEGSGNITWMFSNIWLPDSNSNEPGSHGFIRFRIKPKNNLVLGNVIENFAAIYFDNNPPVITNTAKTTIVTSSGVNGPLADGSNSISVFPNPNDGKFILSFTSGISCKGKLEIINTKGQVVVSKVMDIRSGINHSGISEKLAQGIYLIRVKFADKTYLTKYLVE